MGSGSEISGRLGTWDGQTLDLHYDPNDRVNPYPLLSSGTGHGSRDVYWGKYDDGSDVTVPLVSGVKCIPLSLHVYPPHQPDFSVSSNYPLGLELKLSETSSSLTQISLPRPLSTLSSHRSKLLQETPVGTRSRRREGKPSRKVWRQRVNSTRVRRSGSRLRGLKERKVEDVYGE